jgi:hypothetical protein
MGLEAIFDSKNRHDFKSKLTALLGGSTPAFPDWNSPEFGPPPYTVDAIAIDLYMLRNKIAHGVDLKKAAEDKKTPVDLLKRAALIPELPERTYAGILGEAAMYLLCRAIQKTIGGLAQTSAL